MTTIPRQLGDAFVTISPDSTGFRAKAQADIKKALAGINPEVPVDLKLRDKGKFLTAAEKAVRIQANLDARQAYAQIIELRTRLQELHRTLGAIPIGIDDKDAEAKMASLQRRLLELVQAMAAVSTMDLHGDTSGLISMNEAVLALEGSTDRLARAAAKSVGAFMAQADAEERLIQATLRDVAVQTALNEGLDRYAGKATVAAGATGFLIGAMDRLDAVTGKTATSVNGARLATGLLAATWGNWGGVAGALTGKIALFGGIFDKFLPTWARTVTVWHLAADVAVELIAVWGGAAVAATAFGIAGSDAALEVYNRMKNLHIAADSTRLSMYPLTGAMEQLHDAVRPQVYQIFGDALEIMGKRSGDFARLATGAAAVVDRLAARITNAVLSGKDFKRFTDNAIKSLDGLGNAFGNVFGAIGNVIHVIPGYAQILLGLGVALTGVLENITRMLEPVLKWGLILHGAFLYIGLAVTATLALGRLLIPLFTGFVNAAAGAAFYAVSLADVAANEGLATAAGIALSRVPIVAWAAIAAAVITGLVLIFRSGSDATRDYTANLLKLADAVPIVQALSANQGAQANIASRLAAANKVLSDSGKQLTDQEAKGAAQGQLTKAGMLGVSDTVHRLSTTYTDARNKVTTLTAAQKDLVSQYNTMQSRLQPLVKQFGSLQAAYGILNAAGITTTQLAKDQGTAWDIDHVQIQGTIDAYRAMNGVTGQLNNDLDVLGRTLTDQYTATQKLNDAWSTFITDVTSTQGSFDTVIQGFEVLASHSGDLKLSLGKLKATFSDASGTIALQGKLATATAAVARAQNTLNKLQAGGKATALQLKAAQDTLTGAQDRLTVAQLNLSKAQSGGVAAIDALTPAGIALNQAFTDQIGNIDKLLASWRTAGVANELFVQGTKDAIAPLIKYAQGSNEATAQLIALAQEAGYHGPNSMKELTKWLGNTKNATKDLKAITDQATVQEALLTGAMQSQGKFIANQLIGDINQAILKYEHVTQDAQNYGNAIAQSGRQSDAAKKARDQLVRDLVAAGKAAGDSAGQIQSMVAQVLGIPSKKALEIILEATGTGSVTIKSPFGTQNVSISGQVFGGSGPGTTGPGVAPGPHAAAGALITGGVPGRDSVAATLMPGELVVPAWMVNAGLVNHLSGKIPGFRSRGRHNPAHSYAMGGMPAAYASGGLVGLLNNTVLPGFGQMEKAATGFTTQGISQFAQKAFAAIASQATAASAGGSINLPAGNASGGALAYAQSILPAGWSWPALVALWNQESGWNPFAVNPSSGAYGIPQALPAVWDHPYALGDFVSQIRWGLNYIAGRYGSSQAAEAHELAFHWYDKGGILPPGKIGINTSGRAEMVTPAQGPGSLQETNLLLRQMIHELRQNTRVTSVQGQQFAHGIGVATARGASRGFYGG